MFHVFIVGNFINGRKASKSETVQKLSGNSGSLIFHLTAGGENSMSNWYLSNWPLLQLKQQSGKRDVQLGSPAVTAADISTDTDH